MARKAHGNLNGETWGTAEFHGRPPWINGWNGRLMGRPLGVKPMLTHLSGQHNHYCECPTPRSQFCSPGVTPWLCRSISFTPLFTSSVEQLWITGTCNFCRPP